jgi:hypothetical protein
LRELVERTFPQYPPDIGYARIMRDFEHGPLHLVQSFKGRLTGFGVHNHRSKLIHPKPALVQSISFLYEQDRTAAAQLDYNPNNDQDGRQQHENKQGHNDVEGSLKQTCVCESAGTVNKMRQLSSFLYP